MSHLDLEHLNTDPPIITMVQPDVLPTSVPKANHKIITYASRLASIVDMYPPINHNSLKQHTPIKHCHGKKSVPILKAAFEYTSHGYNEFIKTPRRGNG